MFSRVNAMVVTQHGKDINTVITWLLIDVTAHAVEALNTRFSAPCNYFFFSRGRREPNMIEPLPEVLAGTQRSAPSLLNGARGIVFSGLLVDDLLLDAGFFCKGGRSS